jgi:predicted anti-sigma-YlaC factor YlaD
MKCEEVQSHFSDYVDKTAEAPRAKGIENHLTNCPICSEEFAGLLQCQQLVSGLPELEPPLGFTMRVMAHVRDAGNACSCR